MRDKIYYEWAVEEMVVENGQVTEDIEDNSFYDKIDDIFILNELENLSLPQYELCLWKRKGNEYDGMTDSTWAYVQNGELPEEFNDGSRIPEHMKFQLKRLSS